MAVRFERASSEYAVQADGWDYNSTYTWCAWIYIVSASGSESHAFGGISNNAAIGWDVVSFINSTSKIRGQVQTETGSSAGPESGTSSTATWYHITAARTSSTNFRVWKDAVEISNTFRDVSSRGSAEIGFYVAARNNSGTLTDYGNIRVAAVKVWPGVVLSDAEIAMERMSYAPVRLANLAAWWPMLVGSDRFLEAAGKNANPLEAGVGVTVSDEAGPPIPYFSLPQETVRVAAAAPTDSTQWLARHVRRRTNSRLLRM